MTEPYRAFGISDDAYPEGVDIRRPNRGLGVSYRLIRGVAYDNRAEGKGIILNLGDGLKIKVKGRALQPVARALIAGTCFFIAERDPERSGPPGDGEPDIHSIHVLEPMTFAWGALELEEPPPKDPQTA